MSWIYCKNVFSFVCEETEFDHQSTLTLNESVVSSHYRASEIGKIILEEGGNAIDAATAVGYALSVVDPCCGNLGGGGFMLIRLANGESHFIDFREVAPILATDRMFLNKNGSNLEKASTDSYLSIGVPGTVRGLNYALSNYGTMSVEKIIDPALSLAENGFILSSEDYNILKKGRNKFREDPESRRIFLDQNGLIHQVGRRFIQKDLATSLKKIQTDGDTAFYDGDIADKIVSASISNNGVLSKDDFKNYQVKDREPLRCEYRDYQVITAPLPGGGVTVCQILRILDGYELDRNAYESSQNIHKILSAMLFAFSDRNTKLGDPDFVSDKTSSLLSNNYIEKIRSNIDLSKAQNPSTIFQNDRNGESHDTTHYSVLDRYGNAVSVTYTINSSFGSGKIAPGTGFLLNNEMDDFSTNIEKPNQFGLVQGIKNKIEPGKRPLSSMAPTILLKDNQLHLITGSPGGPTIPTTVAQSIINVVDFEMDPAQAVNSPKLHYQGVPQIVISEPYAINTNVFLELWEMGYKILPIPQWGAAQSIYVSPHTGRIFSINDVRKPAGFFPPKRTDE